jgi:hypothetical protein
MPYLPVAAGAMGPVLAGLIGLGCGVVNLRLLLGATRRLAGGGASKTFVLSSLLRVGVFAIVAVAIAAAGPWWDGIVYIVGLLLPIALYAAGAGRDR